MNVVEMRTLQYMTIDGKRGDVCVADGCSTADLFRAVAAATRCPVEEMRISYAGREITNTTSQPFKFVSDVPVLHVVRRMVGGASSVEVELAQQMRRLMRHPLPGISVGPSQEDVLTWYVQVTGPEGSPYAGGWFDVELRFPRDFPASMPSGAFKTKIYHPNVGMGGGICITQQRSSGSVCAVECVLVALQMLLATPNPDSPLNREAGEQLKTDPAAYKQKAAEYTRRYAMR